MKKKKYIKRTAKILSLLLAVVIVLQISQMYLLAHFDANSVRCEGFYLEDKDSLDVVVLGASEVYSGFSANLAYEQFGFTSYPLSTGANPVSLFKYQIKDIIKYQSPKLIMVEINGALYPDEKKLVDGGNLHKFLDTMPMSFNKAEAILNVVPSDKQGEFFVPFVKYHGAWNDFPEPMKWIESKFKMQMRGYSLLKGNLLRTDYKRESKDVYNDLRNDDSTEKLGAKAEEYLRDLLQYCKDENINIVFARFPHRVDKTSYNRFKRANRAGEIIEEYGFDYLNFEKDYQQTGLNMSTHFSNNEHLNVFGQEIFTKYLGNLMCEKYGIQKSELTDKQKEEWDTCAEYGRRFYKYIKEKTLTENKSTDYGEDNCVLEALEKITV